VTDHELPLVNINNKCVVLVWIELDDINRKVFCNIIKYDALSTVRP